MANPFPSTEPAWGLRAYLILIGCAADRQTVTYDALARRIKRGGPNLLAKPLAWRPQKALATSTLVPGSLQQLTGKRPILTSSSPCGAASAAFLLIQPRCG